jgi:PIN domain nuclease of toxin-antitoxin system
MNYLIDTHILIWYLSGSPSLNQEVIDEIQNPNNIIFVSKASLWEIAIKVSLKKLTIAVSFVELEQFLATKKFILLDFTHMDWQTLSSLPFQHRDPFDRLIISQAINGNLMLITDDSKFKLYPVQLL